MEAIKSERFGLEPHSSASLRFRLNLHLLKCCFGLDVSLSSWNLLDLQEIQTDGEGGEGGGRCGSRGSRHAQQETRDGV